MTIYNYGFKGFMTIAFIDEFNLPYSSQQHLVLMI